MLIAIEETLELEERRPLFHATLDLRLWPAVHPQTEPDVVANGHVREHRVALEHHRDLTRARGKVGHIAVADEHLAIVNVLEPGDTAEQRRLAAAGRAEQHEELAVLHFEADIAERGGLAVGLGEVLDADPRHQRPPHRFNR